ncbi:hypothetical protein CAUPRSCDRAFT_11837 [Caulochytrium protostelioides]|uniref:Uncharacterized protein n=1 Tax=Caulochytrium protostelioides TaxID=1555241 RepID=A0A4P9WVX6_9FUNG|nr:hypothetical protein CAUPRSCDRAFT_11837 [Caulochytrium protostelioides]
MRPSALAACVDDVSLAVRCASAGAVLLFDLRRADRPVATWAALPSRSDAANVAFSPNRRFLVCGGTAPAGRGCLHVLDVATGGRTHPDVVLPTDAGAAATAANDEVVHVAWHRTTHQLFASTASGAVHAFYHDDDAVPRRGLRCALAKLPAFTRRQDAVVHIDERQAYPIIAPYASRDVNDPTQRPAGGAKRGLHAEDTSAARVGPAPPEATRQGRGQDGHVAEGQLQRTLRQLGQNPEADEAWKMDPREAILRHAADAERDPRWVTPAYAKNQPTPILAADSSSDEEGHRPPAAKQQRLA